jgi:hypothetical protein
VGKSRPIATGDVFELKTCDGFVYLQFLGKHREIDVVRVSARTYAQPLQSGSAFSTEPERYVVIVPLLRREEALGQIRFVGSTDLPERLRSSPQLFKANGRRDLDGRHASDGWWLDDGKKEWRVDKLPPEHWFLPYTSIIPVSCLRDYIERGWDPDWEFKPKGREFQLPTKTAPAEAASPKTASFYLFFPDAKAAQRAQHEVEKRGLGLLCRIEKPDDEVSENVRLPWLLVASADVEKLEITSLDELEESLEQIAFGLGGDYDGNELPL